MHNTALNIDEMEVLKMLAVQIDKRQNDLIEEAIRDLLKKLQRKRQGSGH